MRPGISAWVAATLIGSTVTAIAAEVRWAFGPNFCDGEALTRRQTPLIVDGLSIRWFNADCTVVSSYKVAQTWYVQGRCVTEGKTATIPIMLDARGDRLRLGWNREPIEEMQRCR